MSSQLPVQAAAEGAASAAATAVTVAASEAREDERVESTVLLDLWSVRGTVGPQTRVKSSQADESGTHTLQPSVGVYIERGAPRSSTHYRITTYYLSNRVQPRSLYGTHTRYHIRDRVSGRSVRGRGCESVSGATSCACGLAWSCRHRFVARYTYTYTALTTVY